LSALAHVPAAIIFIPVLEVPLALEAAWDAWVHQQHFPEGKYEERGGGKRGADGREGAEGGVRKAVYAYVAVVGV
jgi:hypothetical protein